MFIVCEEIFKIRILLGFRARPSFDTEYVLFLKLDEYLVERLKGRNLCGVNWLTAIDMDQCLGHKVLAQ